MPLPIGLQLYTVRDLMGKDFEGTLARVAEVGYRYVEFAGFYDRKAADIRKLLDRLGLKACSAHVGIDGKPGTVERHCEDAQTLGYDVIVSGLPDGSMRTSAQGYREAVKVLTDATKQAGALGVTYAYHNHSFEFQKFADAGNKTGMDMLFNDANPPLSSELDV
jgi:sugar phosphate isomerase/epimerase